MSTTTGKIKAPQASLAYEADKDLFPHPFVFTGIICALCAFIFNTDANMDMNPLPIAIIVFIILACIAGYLLSVRKLTPERTVILLFVAGFILRLCYVLYTNVNIIDGVTYKERQHDFYKFEGATGHAGYIQQFFENGLKLPNINPTSKAQFYHPPLFHMISAVWMYVLTIIGFTYERCVASIQYLTLFYSSCCMLLSYKIFRSLKLRKAGLIIAFALIAFHPTFIILSGSLNNDILSITFILAAVYNTIAWYQNPELRRILYIALSIGLGMFTKLSAALVAIPIAVVFLMKLIQEKRHYKEYIKQYALFGCVCVPLGMFYSLRNLIMYKVPLTYVPKLSIESDQYIGHYSFFERMFDLSYNPFSSVFLARVHTGASYFEYNPIIALLKSSLFGEYNYALEAQESITLPSTLLFYVNLALAILSFIIIVWMLIKKSDFLATAEKVLMLGMYFLTLISFIKFAFDYPHNCSQDFRYAVFTLIAGAFAIGVFVEKLSDKVRVSSKNKQSATLQTALIGVVYALVGAFCVLSSVVYLMLN